MRSSSEVGATPKSVPHILESIQISRLASVDGFKLSRGWVDQLGEANRFGGSLVGDGT
jgi:hypothetical protein